MTRRGTLGAGLLAAAALAAVAAGCGSGSGLGSSSRTSSSDEVDALAEPLSTVAAKVSR